MDVSRTWTWVGWLVALGCAPGTKSGGLIVDTDDGGTADDGTTASDASMTGSSPEGSETDSVDTQSDDTESEESETGDAPACIATPECGNDIVEALEECDGDTACTSCASTADETVLVAGGGIAPAHILSDGSAVGVVQAEEGAIPELRRWDAAGDMQWSVAFEDPTTRIMDVAVSDDGIVYVAGSDVDGDGVVHAFDTGSPVWSAGTMGSSFSAVATRDGRVVAAGGHLLEGGITEAELWALSDQVHEQWHVRDADLGWFTDVAFVGDDLAVIGLLPTPALQRYDGDGTQLWSAVLPDDGAPDQRPWGVISDGGDGTWTFGQAAGTPYVARHDAEGNVIDELDCIGGATGGVSHAAIDIDGILALAISYELHIDQNYEYHAWFPVLVGDQVAASTTFSSDTQTAFPFAVAWRNDGARILGWTNFGSEGGPGQSQLVLVP